MYLSLANREQQNYLVMVSANETRGRDYSAEAVIYAVAEKE